MDNIKTFLIGALVVIAGFLGVYSINSVPKTSPTVGAFSGPEITSPFVSINGVTRWYNKKSFTTATTTVCAIKSPTATSTLVGGSALFTTSSTTASVVTLAKAATPYATTTPFNLVAIAANAQGTVVASSTMPAADGTIGIGVFAPNQYLVVGMQGGVAGQTFSPVGTCQATFETLQ